jgi:hypothetical protein
VHLSILVLHFDYKHISIAVYTKQNFISVVAGKNPKWSVCLTVCAKLQSASSLCPCNGSADAAHKT